MTSDSNHENGDDALRGSDLRALRKRAGYRAQADVVKELADGTTQQAISLIEKGRTSPDSKTARRLWAHYEERINAKIQRSRTTLREVGRNMTAPPSRFFAESFFQSNQIVRAMKIDPVSHEVIVTIRDPNGVEITWIETAHDVDAWLNFHKSIKAAFPKSK